MVTASMKLKDTFFLEGKYDKPRQHIKKQRPTKFHTVKAMVFLVVMYRCKSWTIRKGELQRIIAFELVLEKTLESPLDCKEIQPGHPKGISPEYSLEGLMLKLKLQYFGHLMQRTDSLEKTLTLGKSEGRRRRG